MASIRTQIELMDRISAPLYNITSALNMTVSAFESVDAAANSSFDSSNFDGVREHINAANMELDEMVQNINESEQQQESFNESMNQGARSASGLERKLLGVAAAYVSIQGLGKLMNLSDTMTLSESRLSLIVDDGGSVEELQNKIFASAQNSRAAYTDVSATIAKLGMMAGDAFTNNDELIEFTELMNKNFVVGGSSATEQASAMYQLTQAMASGRLQGDEYRSIIENAPMLAKSIEDYMTNVQGATGSMKDWASEGLLTADVIKNALFNASDQVNEQFEQMPMTFGQVATSMKNQALMAFDPVLEKLNDIANSERFNIMVSGAIASFVFLSNVAINTMEAIGQAGAFVADNWSIIAPIVLGIATALGIYAGYLAVTNGLELISNGIKLASTIAAYAHAAATGVAVSATVAQTAAQQGLNTALLASPITWIIIAVIAVIAVFYAAVAAVNKFAGTSVSATGIIAGAFMVALAFIGNLFVGFYNLVIDIVGIIWNYIASFAEFFANVFNDPIGSIVRLFAGMADSVLGILEGIASAIDTLFGSNLAGAVSGWRSSLSGMVTDLVGEAEIKVPRMDTSALHLDRFEYGAAFDSGYAFGEGVEDTISNFDIGSLFGGGDIPDPSDYAADGIGSVPSNMAETAENTGAIKDSVDISSEDLKYMRDAAEMETINRYTTAEIKFEQTNQFGDIHETADLDGIVDYLATGWKEAIEAGAEGLHD